MFLAIFSALRASRTALLVVSITDALFKLFSRTLLVSIALSLLFRSAFALALLVAVAAAAGGGGASNPPPPPPPPLIFDNDMAADFIRLAAVTASLLHASMLCFSTMGLVFIMA